MKVSNINGFEMRMSKVRSGKLSINIRGSDPELMGALWDKIKSWIK